MATPKSVQSQTFLRISAVAFLFGWGLHAIDHLRRGMSASPMFIMVGGMVQGVIVIIAITMVLRGDQPGTGGGHLYRHRQCAGVHLCATWSPNFWPTYQDSFSVGARASMSPGSAWVLRPRFRDRHWPTVRLRGHMRETRSPNGDRHSRVEHRLQVRLCIGCDEISPTRCPIARAAHAGGGCGKDMPGAVVLPQAVGPARR